MESKEQKIDVTIKVVEEILKKNKDKEGIEELYNDIQKLKEKRDIN